MPDFIYHLKNGKTMTLSGDTQPSDEEVEALAKENGVELELAESPPPETVQLTREQMEPPPQPVKQEVVSEVPEEKGWLQRGWDTISQPLTNLPSRIANSIADTIDSPSPDRSRFAAQVQGFLGGATQGIGDVISGMTSPINLGTMALTGGSSMAANRGLAGLSSAMRTGARVASAPVIAHGGYELTKPDASPMERAMGLAELAGGTAAMLHSPSVKPKSNNPPILTKDAPKSLAPNLNQGVGDPMLAGSQPYTAPTQQAAPLPNLVIKSDAATPQKVKWARQHGYDFERVNDEGNFVFKKVSDKPLNTPILESEVMSAGHIGKLTDVKKNNPVLEAFNFPRAVMASVDFSAPLRQGFGLIHKKEFYRALPEMFKAWGSEDAFRASQQAIADRALFKPRNQTMIDGTIKKRPSFAEEAGLSLTDLTDLSSREEAIMSTWAEKVPGVRRSNRAYTAFLNKLRADTFESLIKDADILGADSKKNLVVARGLADFVNTATGRGSLGNLERAATVLNSTLFSPRLMASRLKMLNPHYYITANPQVRKEALKSLFAMAAAGNTLGGLAQLTGAGTVEYDPRSSDFGKIKIGNTRLDPWAGHQQYIVAANRLLNPNKEYVDFLPKGQEIKSSTSGKIYDLWNPKKPFDPTHMDVIERFGRGKAHPVLGFAWSLLKGQRELSGEKMNFTTMNPFENAIAQRFIPLIMQDIYEVSKNDPGLLPITVPASTFGMSVQSYDEN